MGNGTIETEKGKPIGIRLLLLFSLFLYIRTGDGAFYNYSKFKYHPLINIQLFAHYIIFLGEVNWDETSPFYPQAHVLINLFLFSHIFSQLSVNYNCEKIHWRLFFIRLRWLSTFPPAQFPVSINNWNYP